MPADDHPSKPPVLVALLAVLAALGVTALFGGGQFLLDPSGSIVGMPTSALEGSPFPDYTVPGLVLFSVLGVLPLAVCYGLLARRRCAPTAAGLVGLATVAWIAVQGVIVGFGHWLQWLYLVVGVVIVGLAVQPSVRGYCDGQSGEPQR